MRVTLDLGSITLEQPLRTRNKKKNGGGDYVSK